MNEYDVVVIGGGAAGLSAALVLARAQRRVAVVDAGEPRNGPAQHLQGFLSRDGLPPAELLRLGREEVTGYGADVVAARVVGVRRTASAEPRFDVRLADGTVLRARRVLVATGLRDVLPDIPGLRERWGRDLLHCPYCHGYEVREQPLGVIGATPEAVMHAHLVRQWSPDVVLFTHTDDLSRRTTARRWSPARSAWSTGRSPASSSRTTRSPASSSWTAASSPGRPSSCGPGWCPTTTVLTGLGCAIDDNGWVVSDATGRTSVPGVWVAGNVANPRAQVITAAGEGSSAAIALNADLVDEDVAAAVLAFRRSI